MIFHFLRPNDGEKIREWGNLSTVFFVFFVGRILTAQKATKRTKKGECVYGLSQKEGGCIGNL